MRTILGLFLIAGGAMAQGRSCAEMAKLDMPGVTFTKAAPAAEPVAHCRVDGVIDRRTGAGGKEYGIGFALALPDQWNGRFLFQGGGGLNGNVANPLGGQAAGDRPALARGFAVVTTDSGHKGAVFDGSFFADQQASLDFYYVAIGRVALLAKSVIATFYGRPAEHSYYDGCSTGGREAMTMTQRYPMYFDGVIAGDPAMRTGYSNLALAYIGATFDRAASRDASGKPAELFSQPEKDLIVKSLLDKCDAKDGLKDGMIFNAKGCDFDPTELACVGGKTTACLPPEKAAALKKALAGPKDVHGDAIYPGFPYDAGIGQASQRLPGLLFGPRIPVPVPSDSATFDLEREAERVANDVNGRAGDSLWTNLSTFSGHGGKLILYHGLGDPWFSPLDTAGYYENLIRDDGGRAKVESWSRMFLVPGMGHCAGGSATLDRFDMLTAITDWVEKGAAPDAVTATGAAFPGRSRPLCAYPKHAQYTGQGDPNDAKNFTCRE
ncbi:MAG TPA: tannase/feruloyl esterase family alpha/beta hydrolase [Bryobacteraceae bacterium]|jgi:feruloyl esterase